MKSKVQLALFTGLLICLFSGAGAQVRKRTIDIGSPSLWQIYNRELQSISKDSVVFKPAEVDGMWMLKDEIFGDGTFEFEVRGENNMNQNFVGLAFNVQDEKTHELVYFRPFNFFNPDTVRRPRSVQYVCAPDHPWEKLRAEHPGKYENRIVPTPDPDRWFHVKIIIARPSIKVYVNNNPTPCLSVESLSSFSSGKIGLWVGPKTRASFAKLTFLPAQPASNR